MRKLLFTLSAFLLISSIVYSQTSNLLVNSSGLSKKKLCKKQLERLERFSRPYLAFEISGGYAMPLYDLYGKSTSDIYEFKNYAVQNGYNFSFKIKLAGQYFKKFQIMPYWQLGYARFLGTENYAYNTPMFLNGYPDTGYVIPSKVKGTSSVSIHHPYTSLGFQVDYFADKNKRHIIYSGLDLSMQVMFGRIYDQKFGQVEDHNNIAQAVRGGLSFNAGYSYRMTDMFGIGGGIRAQISNMFGKTSKGSTDTRESNFNDKDYDKGNIKFSDRTVGYFSVFVTTSFYLGNKQ